MPGIVFCTVENSSQANRVLDQMKTSGFSATDISVLVPSQLLQNSFAETSFSQSYAENEFDGQNTYVSMGERVGGRIEWSAGMGVLSIFGMRPIVAAGPLMTSLKGVEFEGAFEDIFKVWKGSGLTESEVMALREKSNNGSIFIAVQAQNDIEIEVIAKLFKVSGAKDISTSHELSESD